MVKKKRKKIKKRRVIKFRGSLKVSINATDEREAVTKLRKLFFRYIENEYPSFIFLSEFIVDNIIVGLERGWYSARGRDEIKGKLEWTNRVRGGWRKIQVDIK